MKVRVISKKLNHVIVDEDKSLRRVRVDDEFEVADIPASWKGLVVQVGKPTEKVAVTNPAKDPEATKATKKITSATK